MGGGDGMPYFVFYTIAYLPSIAFIIAMTIYCYIHRIDIDDQWGENGKLKEEYKKPVLIQILIFAAALAFNMIMVIIGEFIYK
jgi:hypothetical protein